MHFLKTSHIIILVSTQAGNHYVKSIIFKERLLLSPKWPIFLASLLWRLTMLIAIRYVRPKNFYFLKMILSRESGMEASGQTF